MNREEARKLLGGYACGTLTPDEQQALFAAALEDQELFDELAREQSLRDALSDPAARARLLRELDNSKSGWGQRMGNWVWAHAVGLAATACLLAVVVYVASQVHPPAERIRMIANEPTRVEVAESFEPAPGARRVFDPNSIPKHTAAAPQLPSPPVLPKTAPPRNVPFPAAIATPAQEMQVADLKAASPQMAAADKATVGTAPISEATQEFSAQANVPQRGLDARDANTRSTASARSAEAVALSFPRSDSSAPSPQPGPRYRVLLKGRDGVFRETDGKEYSVGDVVKLEFTLDRPGSLHFAEIGAGGAPGAALSSFRAEKLATSAEILLNRQGLKQVIAVFTPDPVDSNAAGRRATPGATAPASGAVTPTRTLITFEVK